MPFIKQRFDHTIPEDQWSLKSNMIWKHRPQNAGFNTATNMYNEAESSDFFEYESNLVFNDIMTMLQATDISDITYDTDKFLITIFGLPVYFLVSTCNIGNWMSGNNIYSYYEKHIYCTTPQFDIDAITLFGFQYCYPYNSNEYNLALLQSITDKYYNNDKLKIGYTLEVYWNENFVHMVVSDYTDVHKSSLCFIMKGTSLDGTEVLYICSNPNSNLGAYDASIDSRAIESWNGSYNTRIYGTTHKIINITDVSKMTYYCIKKYNEQNDVRIPENHYLWFQHNANPMVFESKADSGYVTTDFLKPETRKKFLKRKPRCMGGLINFEHVIEGDAGIVYGNMYEINGLQYYCPSDSAILQRYHENPLKYQQVAPKWMLEL